VQYLVPFVDPRTHYRRLKTEIDHAITDTLGRGDLVLRQQLADFESHLASFVGVRYAVGLNSCYHALTFALLSLRLAPRDEVITVAHTFVATVSAIVHAGGTPILVEVCDDFTMDPDAVERAITPRTRAILPVHLNGRVCQMDRLMAIADRYGLAVVEDAAQALGATFVGLGAGSIGLAGCFSFYPFKSLGGLGDGGALTTNDGALARFATLLRFNGEDRATGEFHHHGYTALLDNVQAAVLDVKLRHLPSWLEHRRQIAREYGQALNGVGDVVLPPFDDDKRHDTFQNYVIRTRHRDALRAYLTSSGIETLVHWARPMWTHSGLGLQDPHLPGTERLCREVISLPMSAETTSDHVRAVADAIRAFFT
jgi:dTDP-4-amino-4,6-dideoxygalactose transaminase